MPRLFSALHQASIIIEKTYPYDGELCLSY